MTDTQKVPGPVLKPLPLPPGYVVPTTLPEAKARLAEMTTRMINIETQLGNENRLDETGQRMAWADWNDWRQRAKGALRWLREEKRLLKEWIAAQPPEPKKVTPGSANLADTDRLLRAAFAALTELAAHVRVMDAELAALKAGGE